MHSDHESHPPTVKTPQSQPHMTGTIEWGWDEYCGDAAKAMAISYNWL